jgi:hypothetical protein
MIFSAGVMKPSQNPSCEKNLICEKNCIGSGKIERVACLGGWKCKMIATLLRKLKNTIPISKSLYNLSFTYTLSLSHLSLSHTHTNTHTNTHTQLSTFIHSHTYTNTHTDTITHIHTPILTNTSTHTDTITHIPSLIASQSFSLSSKLARAIQIHSLTWKYKRKIRINFKVKLDRYLTFFKTAALDFKMLQVILFKWIG